MAHLYPMKPNPNVKINNQTWMSICMCLKMLVSINLLPSAPLRILMFSIKTRQIFFKIELEKCYFHLFHLIFNPHSQKKIIKFQQFCTSNSKLSFNSRRWNYYSMVFQKKTTSNSKSS